MSRKQKLHLMSLGIILVCLSGASIMACSTSEGAESEQGTPGDTVAVVSTGTALFDHFYYKGDDEVYNLNPLPDESYFYNPILPGWYSDPSICTNGEGDYFLVTSTFAYYPGVPLFHSRDLVNWKQIGHVLNRTSQLVNLEGQDASGGVYAPSISYNPNNKTYYMITTNVAYGNFFVKTTDPFGTWSEPIRLPDVSGIDPSFFFDDDGRAYIVNNAEAPNNQPEYDGHRSIRIHEFDVATDKTIGTEQVLVNKGAFPEDNPIWIEGPHMYRIRGSYFLMSAEGGTGGWHSEVVFKSSSPWGPFVAWEKNPILTQRTLPERSNPVTCAGHADMVQTVEGDWWAVFLGCRPLNNDFENLGRETFLMPVRWSDDGWPYITQGSDLVSLRLKRDGVVRGDTVTFGNFELCDTFDASTLGLAWLTLRAPATDCYSLTEHPHFLALHCAPVAATDKSTPAFVCRRLQHHVFDSSTTMTFDPTDDEAAGLLLFKDETHQYFMGVHRNGGDKYITLWKVDSAGKSVVISKALAEDVQTIELRITSTGLVFNFYYATAADKWLPLMEGVDARYLSTALAGGFTGTLIGMYATSKN